MSQTNEHNRKKRMARKMQRPFEKFSGSSPFDCHDWRERARKKLKKQAKQRIDKFKREKIIKRSIRTNKNQKNV
jgi:hypothetical protein